MGAESPQVRDASVTDVPAMANLAARKRRQYRDHAAPFQRPAANATEVHEAFLPKLLAWPAFQVLVHESAGVVDGFIVGRFGSAPPPFGAGPLVHVDDFAVEEPDDWGSVGRSLLTALTRRAVEADIDTAIVVSGPRSVDPAKVAFLSEWLSVTAEWWVKPLEPSEAPLPEQAGFEAIVGPAPPVYDPGGLTALLLEIDDPSRVATFEEYAAAAGAVIAIVPTFVTRTELREELRARSYGIASEWYEGDTATLLETRRS